MIEIILIMIAITAIIIAIILLAVDYRTMRDTWNKITKIEHRMNRLEREMKK